MKDDGYYGSEYERDRKWSEDEKQKIGEQQNRPPDTTADVSRGTVSLA